jgi:hypothetical protein
MCVFDISNEKFSYFQVRIGQEISAQYQLSGRAAIESLLFMASKKLKIG